MLLKKNLEAGLKFLLLILCTPKLTSMIVFHETSNGYSNIARPTGMDITEEGALCPRQKQKFWWCCDTQVRVLGFGAQHRQRRWSWRWQLLLVERGKVVLPMPVKVSWVKDNSSSQGDPSPDSHFLPHSHVLPVSLGCMLLGHSLGTKRLDEFLQESNNNKQDEIEDVENPPSPVSWHHWHNQLPHQFDPNQLAQTLQVCFCCTHRPSSGPLERQILLLQQWSLLGHSDVEGRQRPAWVPTILPGLLFYSYHLADPSLQPQAQPCSQGSGPLFTHGTHENPMPCTGVTGQAGNPSSLSLRLCTGLHTWQLPRWATSASWDRFLNGLRERLKNTVQKKLWK